MGRKKKSNNNSEKGEQTRTSLIEMVSKTMKEKGHTFLRTMQITRLMGKNKGIIRYHYNNLNDLLRTYIRQKDYWPRFFEKVKAGGQMNRTGAQKLFTELMQENLKMLLVEPEMQKIILWQISEESQMLKNVSDEREREGAKVMDFAAPYFDGTDVNFNAVLSLILGGTYYLVLHNETNKSTVCGIDINRERDRAEVLKTIGQFISWAFEKAEGEQPSDGN